MTGDPLSDGSAEKSSWWSAVPGLVKFGALVFVGFWFSIALAMLISADGTSSFAGSVGLSGVLAAALTVLVGVVWGLTVANQRRLDRNESRWLARNPSVAPAHPDRFSVNAPKGAAPLCDIDGRRLEYRWSHGRGYSVAYTLAIRSERRSLLTVTSARDPQVLEAKVMRSGLEGTVLDVPVTMKLRRRGLLRRHRRIDITVGDRALRYTWGRSRPILVRGADRSDVVMRATSGDTYELLRPVSEHEELVAATLALGSAKDAIRSPVWGFLEAILDGI